MFKHALPALVFFFSFQISVIAQFGTSHDIVNYSPKEYHAHNQNWQSIQDSRGVMYFANGDGILHFDGTFWGNIPTATLTNVLSLAIDNNETIYYGGIGELGYLEEDSSGFYSAVQILPEKYKEQFASEFFWSIHKIEGGVIARSENYFVTIKKDKVEVFNVVNGKTKKSFNLGSEIWFQNENKEIFWFYAENPEVQYRFTDTLFDSTNSLSGIQDLGNNKRMLITVSTGVFIYDIEKKQILKQPDSFYNIEGIDVVNADLLPNGELVLCSSNVGVVILDKLGEICFHYHDANGLNTNSIQSSYLDREGILWFTSNEGISKALYNIPYTVLQEEGSELKGISNGILKHDNKVYVATSEGVFIINEFESIDLAKSPVTKVKNMNWQTFDIASIGDDVIAASPSGIFLIKEDSATIISNVYSRGICVPEGRIDQMIVGGRDRIIFFEKKQNEWIVVETLDNFPDEVLLFEQDKTRKDKLIIWTGLYNIGAAILECNKDFSDVSYNIVGKDNGVNDGYVLPFLVDGKMYFAPKEPGGIYNFDDDKSLFHFDDKITPILGKEISSWIVKEDYYKNIYLENSGPVYVLRKRTNTYEVDSFSLSTLNLGYINEIYIDDGGICWLAGESGIARFNSTINKDFSSKYDILLKGVIANRDSVIFNGNFYNDGKAVINQQGEIPHLPYNLNNLSFEFASLYYNGSSKTEYSYMLFGDDEVFSKWEKGNKAVYTNLHEGEYIFKVKSKNIYGLESNIFEYKFTILPPWYRTYWAYIIYAVLGIIVIGLIVLLISYRLRKANDRLQMLVNEKTHEIVLQRDELAHQKEELLERNQEVMDSINYAKRIQNAILPPSKLVKEYLTNSFILYKPKDIVAGDFYWMEHREEKVLFAAADCTGHGVPGAMVSVVCNNGLNRSVREHGLTDPGEILDKTREIIIEEFEKSDEDVKDGMDIALCSLEGTTLKYAGANIPLWIIRTSPDGRQDGEIIETKANKQPIGKFDKQTPYTTHTFTLLEGDTVYIFSDGYVDQFGGEKEKKFKAKAFKTLLLSIQEMSLENQKSKIDNVFEAWKGDLEQIDDVCVIGVRI